jgi:nucleoporin NUP82
MRALGLAVESIRQQIDSVRSAHREADTRASLQQRELARQQETCASILASLDRLKNVLPARTQHRLETARENQVEILSRTERILRKLAQEASPELNEHERRWFEELRRMKAEICGTGRFDADSLKARVSSVRPFMILFALLLTLPRIANTTPDQRSSFAPRSGRI